MSFNVKHYGAVGDGIADDRLAIQAAINAAAATHDEVYIPHGTYLLSQAGSAAWCLNVPGNVQLRGAGPGGAVLKQVANIAAAVRALHIQGDDVVIRDLCVDGNRANQAVADPAVQRHGLFVERSARLSVNNVLARQFTGDGFVMYNGVTNPTFLNCRAEDNGRNGLTFNPVQNAAGVDGARIIGCEFARNAAQQIDSEAFVPVTNVSIIGCYVEPGPSADYAITTSTNLETVFNKSWTIADCTIRGSLLVLWVEGISIVGNHFLNATPLSCVEISHHARGVSIIGNTMFHTTTSQKVPVIQVRGTGTGQVPESIVISGNRLDAKNVAQTNGVAVSGVDSITITDNVLDGPGLHDPSTTWAGIDLRAVKDVGTSRSYIVRGNTIRNWGDMAVRMTGDVSPEHAELLALDVSHNVFDDTAGTMTIGVSFEADHPPMHAVRSTVAVGNQCIGGVTTPIASWPAGAMVVGALRGHL